MVSRGCRSCRLVALAAVLLTGSYCVGDNAERFVTEPTDEVAAKGQIVELKCIVENRVGQVQWLRDGFGLGIGPTFDGYPRYKVNENPGAGVYDLVIADVQLEDDATFQCQVGATETTSGLMSRVATLTVKVPPSSVSLDGAPVVDVIAGDASELVCRAIGSRPAASMVWTRDGAAVDASPTTMETPNEGKLVDSASRLTIRPTLEDQGATYSCHVEHSAALRTLDAQVQLNVLYAPLVSMRMTTGEKIREFDRVEFTCTATGNPPVDEWKWFSNDDVISGEDRDTLVIERIDRSFNGKTIACQGRNKVASTRASAVIDVRYGPKFVADVAELTADSGAAEITMSCETDSNPAARYSWSRDIAPSLVLSRDPSLTVGPVTDDSFGLYVCTASVDGYQSIQRAVRLLMNGPAIVTSARIQSARFGDEAAVACHVRAIPRPNYVTWTRDGLPLHVDKHDRYSIEEKDVPYGRLSLLKISSVQDSDFGVFNCSTDNGYGVVNVEITLSKNAIVPLYYILGASFAGLLLVIIVCVVVFVCRRRRLAGSEIGSDSSECRMTGGKKDCLAIQDSKMDYSSKSSDHGELADSFPGDNYIDAWKTGKFNGRHPQGTSPLSRDHYYYPCDSWSRHSANYPQSPSIHGEQGTRPPSTCIYDVSDSRRPGSVDDFRGDNAYWPEVYGTLRPSRGMPPRREVTTPYDFRPIRTTSPSPIPVEYSQLATNV